MTVAGRDQWSDSVENQHPIATVRQALSQRRPLRQINGEAHVHSPTKRRRRGGRKDITGCPLKLKDADDRRWPTLQVCGWQSLGTLLLEVLGCLGTRDIIERAAPVCRTWRCVAQGPELWAILRRRVWLVDQLVVVEKIVERRSKGKIFRCRQLGTGENCLLRVVNLELSNAGRDDGVPTSFLREAALLKRVVHPNIVKFYGAEVRGIYAFTCAEYVSESFTAWHTRLEVLTGLAKLSDIRVKFRQLLAGLSFLHGQGIMHRNLKPDNLFIDQQGTVKLGDFTTSRMLDIPLEAYTPEDPKERDCSGREMRRMWYRAPEILLRNDIYSSKVDMWAVGCLFAEAALGKQLFSSDSEIDHLFRIFRLVGTPTAASWPEVVTMKNFSPMFPLFSGFDFAQVARAAYCASAVDQDELTSQAQPDRSEVLQHAASVVTALGLEGTFVLDRLLKVRPGERADADGILASPFFVNSSALAEFAELHPVTSRWLQGKIPSLAVKKLPSLSAHPHSEQLKTDLFGELGKGTFCNAAFPLIAAQPGLIPPHQAWSIVRAMQLRERNGSSLGALGCTCPALPPGFSAHDRSTMIDFIVQLSNALMLADHTLHLAVDGVDRYLAQETQAIAASQFKVLAATCLKIADAFAEQSKEYYKQESTQEYAEAAMAEISQRQLLECEKGMLPKLGFDIWLPTVHWFTQCFLAYGRFTSRGSTAKIAVFIGDLMLLDYDILTYAPSMRAQCALILAVFLASEAKRTSAKGARATDCSELVLRYWDENVRQHVCCSNTAIEATMCLKAVVHIVVEKRRAWKGSNLVCIEAKHQNVARAIVYPEVFPSSQLVKHMLSDCQRN